MKAKTAVAAILILGALAPAATASAAIKNGVCESGEVCMYNGFRATGSVYDNDTGTDGNLSNNVYPGTSTSVNNTIGSIQNLSSAYMDFFKGFNFADDSFCLPPGTSASFDAPLTAYMNNSISSEGSISSC